MNLLIACVVAVAAVVAVVVVVRRVRQAREDRQPPPPRTDPFATDGSRPDPRRLKIGDIVGFDGRDYVVRGTIRLDQSGFAWEEHLLDDTTSRVWLSVEDDEGLELCLWNRVSGSPQVPGAASLTDGGVDYLLAERGEAVFRAEGTTGTASSGDMEYIDYVAGDRRLSFERFGATTWEVSRGRVVGERELTIYPVSD